MQHADAFSRYPVENAPATESEEATNPERKTIYSLTTFDDSIAMVQSRDELIKSNIKSWNNSEPERRNLEKEEFVVRNGILYRKVKVGDGKRLLFVVPRMMRKYVAILMHNQSGHLGKDNTIALMKERYWFAGMKDYVAKHIRSCMECLFNRDLALPCHTAGDEATPSRYDRPCGTSTDLQWKATHFGDGGQSVQVRGSGCREIDRDSVLHRIPREGFPTVRCTG